MTDTEVYEAYVAKTKRFYQVHCRADWEDCLHAGFIPFWNACKSGEIMDTNGFAYGVAKNIVHNYKRKRWIYHKRLSPLSVLEHTHYSNWVISNESRYVSSRFPKALLRLKEVASPVEYESFQRFYFQNQSFEQAYTEMGITALHFKNSKYKAVRKFSKIMRTILANENIH